MILDRNRSNIVSGCCSEVFDDSIGVGKEFTYDESDLTKSPREFEEVSRNFAEQSRRFKVVIEVSYALKFPTYIEDSRNLISSVTLKRVQLERRRSRKE